MQNLRQPAWHREAGSDLDLEPQVHLAGHVAPADAPVVHGRLVQHDQDVGGGGSQLAEVVDQCLVQAAFGLPGAAGEHRDLDQDEVVATAGWQLEVLACIFNDALHPVAFGIRRASPSWLLEDMTASQYFV